MPKPVWKPNLSSWIIFFKRKWIPLFLSAVKKAPKHCRSCVCTMGDYVVTARLALLRFPGSAPRAESLVVRKSKHPNQRQFSNFDFKVFIYPRHCSLCGRRFETSFKNLCSSRADVLSAGMLLLTLWCKAVWSKEPLKRSAFGSIVCLEGGFDVEECSHLGIKLSVS